ncbi:hypothetical protein C8R47DRAFT_1086993 [Mycena vitilis]|nr:hypothetical protein C8R47DRAFT_1086993 [Mycena vitilis]
MTTTKTSERFCAADADLTVTSSDGMLFKVHRKNLEFHSDIFADAASATGHQEDDGIIDLSETSDVLDLLFQFMYRQRQPELKGLDFELLAALAEAAGKYSVPVVLDCCQPHLRAFISKHPWEILRLGLKHGISTDIIDEAARETMKDGLEQALRVLEPADFREWIFFQERWHREWQIFLGAFIASCLGSSVASLVSRCLAEPNGCYKFRGQLRERMKTQINVAPSATEEILNMRFHSALNMSFHSILVPSEM